MYDAKRINVGALMGLGLIVLVTGAAGWRDRARLHARDLCRAGTAVMSCAG